MALLTGPVEIALFALIFAVAIVALAIYLLPALIAVARGHKDALAIAALTIFLGWSIFAWVVALVWALTNRNPFYADNRGRDVW